MEKNEFRAVIKHLHMKHGIIHIDYLPSKQTTNGDYYARFNNILKKKRSHLTKKTVLFHQDCSVPMAKFNEFRYELFPHPAYSPDLAPLRLSPVSKPEEMVQRKEIHHQRAAHRRNRGL
ncbi:SETMR methyltransferase, partial [Acromyrmex charruanus]